MNEKDYYREIFDMVTPADSDEDFINKVIEKAERDSANLNFKRVNSQRPMYAVSAALVAVIALTAAFIAVFGRDADEYAEYKRLQSENGVADSDELEFSEIYAGASGIEDSDAANPNNFYNINVVTNSFDRLSFEVADIRGDERIVLIDIEAWHEDLYFNDVEQFYSLYRGRFENWGISLLENEYVESRGYYSYGSSSHGAFIRDGKVCWTVIFSCLDGDNLLQGREFQLVLFNTDDRMIYGENNRTTFVPHAIINSTIINVTANYTPAKARVALFPLDDTDADDIVKIEISDYSLNVYFAETAQLEGRQYLVPNYFFAIYERHSYYCELSGTAFVDYDQRYTQYLYSPENSGNTEFDINEVTAIIFNGVRYYTLSELSDISESEQEFFGIY